MLSHDPTSDKHVWMDKPHVYIQFFLSKLLYFIVFDVDCTGFES